MSRLLVVRPEITELDINPLRVTPDGLIALDALILILQVGALLPVQWRDSR